MENKYFLLEIREDNRLVRVIRILFGLICCGIAIFWLYYKFTSAKSGETQWVTIAFLFFFGAFQIYSGFGLNVKFIEFSTGNIKLKKNSILPAVDLPCDQIEKIEMFPLKVVFFSKTGKKILLRFGISDPDKIEKIKAEIIRFSEDNNLNLEIKEEEIFD